MEVWFNRMWIKLTKYSILIIKCWELLREEPWRFDSTECEKKWVSWLKRMVEQKNA